MIRIFAVFFALTSPVILYSQSNSASQKTSLKTIENGFKISGTTTGFADGTTVSLLNGNTGAPEQSINITNGKFLFTGKLETPDFKILSFQDQQEYVTLFIENANIEVAVSKPSISKAIVKGSVANADFKKFDAVAAPYSDVFAGSAPMTEEIILQASQALNKYIDSNNDTYIVPLAIYRSYQLTGDEQLLEKQFLNVNEKYTATPLGQFVANQVSENAKHPIGKPVANFIQADTAGNPVSLDSFKGKYVLLDFWASWCRPCRQENPNVVAAYNKFKSKNFTVLGISLDQARKAWIDAIAMDNLNWPHVSDLKGWGNTVAALYNVGSIPQNFLIDPNGILIAKNLRGEALNRKLTRLIKDQ